MRAIPKADPKTFCSIVYAFVLFYLMSCAGGCGSGSSSGSGSTGPSTADPPPPPSLNVSLAHSGNFMDGEQGATYAVTVSNVGKVPTDGTATVVTDTIPSGLMLVSMSGSGWSCVSNSCTRSDVLPSEQSYPPITVTVNVAADASSPVTNWVSVSGGGSASANGNDPTTIDLPQITVVISPDSAVVEAGLTKQFSAHVVGDASNAGVTWSVSSAQDSICEDSCGTIDSHGLYTAPPAFYLPGDSEGLASVTATSKAYPGLEASVVVYITPTPTGIFVSPRLATVPKGSSQQFTAGGSPEGAIPVVQWSVSGAGCGGAGCGLITPDGIYTAPTVLPNPPTVTVTATSVTDSSVKGSAPVTLGANPNNARLDGRYAFQMRDSGLDAIDTSGVDSIIGSFTTDGNGHITGGVFDGYFDSGFETDFFCGCFNAPILGGTYSVGEDNRGAITLILGSDSSPTTEYNLSFSFALHAFVSGVAERAQLGGGMSAGVSQTRFVEGTLARQDPTAFSDAAIAGDYAFSLSCNTTLPCPTWPFAANVEAVGRFTMNGGLITNGETDVLDGWNVPNRAPTTLSFGGNYNVESSGRISVSFSGAPFTSLAGYVISAKELLLTDITFYIFPETFLTGSALRRSGGAFSTASLNGPAVLYGSDDTLDGNHLNVYLTAFDGNGIVTGSGDLADQNGVVTSAPFTGTYSVDPDGLGRGIFNPTGGPFPANVSAPFYLVEPGRAFVLGFGDLESQSGAPFNNASLSGSYSLDAGDPFSPASGILSADGEGGVKGTADSTDRDDLPIGTTFTGSYSLAANGEGTLTTTPDAGPPVNWLMYMVSQWKVLLRSPSSGGLQSTLQK